MKNKLIKIFFFLATITFVSYDHAGESNSKDEGSSTVPPFFKSKEFLTGLINYKTDTNFIEIPKQYAYREEMYLLKETYQAWYKMYSAAKKEGITLTIISAARTHTEQCWIWEDKWTKPKYQSEDRIEKVKNILEYSAMPGTSRHHWGTDVDMNSQSDNYFQSGIGKKTYDWLTANACNYGFCQVYDATYANRRGHGEEKWHWSYSPISKHLPEIYASTVHYIDIKGFSGSEYAKQLNVIEDYVTSVAGSCCD